MPVPLQPIPLRRTTCPVFTYRHHVAHEGRVRRYEEEPAGWPLCVDCVRRRSAAHWPALALAKRSTDATGKTGGIGRGSDPPDRASGCCRSARACSTQGTRSCRASQGLAANTPPAAATGAAPATSCRAAPDITSLTCRTRCTSRCNSATRPGRTGGCGAPCCSAVGQACTALPAGRPVAIQRCRLPAKPATALPFAQQTAQRTGQDSRQGFDRSRRPAATCGNRPFQRFRAAGPGRAGDRDALALRARQTRRRGRSHVV